MALKITLEHEKDKKAIAVYKDCDIKAHYLLKDSDDEYRIFKIVSHIIKRLEGW